LNHFASILWLVLSYFQELRDSGMAKIRYALSLEVRNIGMWAS
jgi:hypothetical protein